MIDSKQAEERNRMFTQRENFMKDIENKKQEIIVYKTANGMDLPVKTDGETVWMTIEQMSNLFGRDISVIGKHVRAVFKEGELPAEGFRQILPKTSTGGRPVTIFALDVLISVGYRVKSPEGVRFRQWATRILREMLLNRVNEMREIAKLTRRVDTMEGDIKQIKGGMKYLVQQISVPDTLRRKIGFGAKPGETSDTPYGRKVAEVES